MRRAEVIGWVVRATFSSRLWSGPESHGVRGLGYECVTTRREAKVFTSLAKAREEASTYGERHAAKVFRVRARRCGA